MHSTVTNTDLKRLVSVNQLESTIKIDNIKVLFYYWIRLFEIKFNKIIKKLKIMRTLNHYHLRIQNLSTTKGLMWKSQRRFK